METAFLDTATSLAKGNRNEYEVMPCHAQMSSLVERAAPMVTPMQSSDPHSLGRSLGTLFQQTTLILYGLSHTEGLTLEIDFFTSQPLLPLALASVLGCEAKQIYESLKAGLFDMTSDAHGITARGPRGGAK